MMRIILNRLVFLAVAVVIANFAGFAYAMIAHRVQAAQNPYGSSQEGLPPIWTEYQVYAAGLLRGDLGTLPVGTGQPLTETLTAAAGASLGLLGLAFGLSLAVGLIVGVTAVRIETSAIPRWLIPISTVGLAMPSFYVGALCIMGLVFWALHSPTSTAPLPVQGFGWDSHLILPLLALSVRPAAQIASLTVSLLVGELAQPYIIAARSRGNDWRRIRWRHALRPVLAPIILAVAGSLRLLIGELIVVEWLFSWPGLGRLMALSLIAPRIAGPGGGDDASLFFLLPPLVAALLVIFTVLFVLADTVAVLLARTTDPQLRVAAGDPHGH
jgi:peptide/nickel transport system permease protein